MCAPNLSTEVEASGCLIPRQVDMFKRECVPGAKLALNKPAIVCKHRIASGSSTTADHRARHVFRHSSELPSPPRNGTAPMGFYPSLWVPTVY